MAAERQIFRDPPLAEAIFGTTQWSWLWLAIRLWLGYQWINAGAQKITNAAWMDSGAAVRGFWERAVEVPEQGRPLIAYDWYRNFIEFLLNGGHYTWFAKVVVFGELAVGIGLVLGALVGVAAAFGALMNFNFMMAGVASTNPVLFGLAVLLILGWKTAGWWGLDRWLLPALGTPWQRGPLLRSGYRGPWRGRIQSINGPGLADEGSNRD